MKFLIVVCIAIAPVIQTATASIGKTGGWSPVKDVNSADFQRIINFATATISSGSNDLYLMRPVEVLNAEQQVVAGMNYKFTIRIRQTECKKNRSANVDINDCNFLYCGRTEKCDVVVWDKRWLKETKVTSLTCTKEPKSC
nr:venom protein [Lampona murina]